MSLQQSLYKILECDLLVLIFFSLLEDLEGDIAIEQLPFFAVSHIPLIDAIERPANLILIEHGGLMIANVLKLIEDGLVILQHNKLIIQGREEWWVVWMFVIGYF